MGKLDNKVAIITGGNAGVVKKLRNCLRVKEQKLLFQQDVNKSWKKQQKKLKQQEELFYVFLLIFLKWMMLKLSK